MSATPQTPDWQQLFPLLTEQPAAITRHFKTLTLPANSIAFHQGDQCDNYLLVLDGVVKVIARSENGREIVLYRVRKGGSCILTTTCLLSKTRYPAEGITETEVTALLIPAKVFHQALRESDSFRDLIFDSYGQRLTEVIALVESISFEHIAARLARFLVQQDSNPVHTTHQNLATELGSAREVISRQLKQFEKQGLIQQHRGEIRILQKQALLALCHDSD